MADYKWRQNLACLATYKVLEGDQFLDQFEDKDLSFDKAGAKKLGELRYYPKTTNNPQIIELLALEIARKFLGYVIKLYSVKKEKPQTSAAIIQALQAKFQKKDATIVQLAQELDDLLEFEDEKAAS